MPRVAHKIDIVKQFMMIWIKKYIHILCNVEILNILSIGLTDMLGIVQMQLFPTGDCMELLMQWIT